MAAADVVTEVDGHTVGLSNLDKELFPDGTTKAEVVHYYSQIASFLLPHLADRCITRLRFPNGSTGASFYEKNIPAGTPDWVTTQAVDASGTPLLYPLADSPATLVWLANLAALELHTPQWLVHDTPGWHDADTPLLLDDVLATTVVVDLDPGPGISRVQLAEAAMIVATEMASDGLVPFAKTSGNKGFQLYASVEPVSWRSTVGYVHDVGKRLVSRHPDRFVVVMAKAERTERIYVDYLQNQGARNTIAPYSLRAKDTASVATPITFEELASVTSDDDLRFDAHDVLDRVARLGDLWADLLDPALRVPLPWAPSN